MASKNSSSKKPAAAKPAAKSPAKAAAKPAKPATAKVVKATRPSRPEKHEKPGTGRTNRAVSAERVRPESGSQRPERRIAEPVALSGKVSSPFDRSELAEWRRTLLEHRNEISQDIQHLEQGAMEAEDGHTTPNHIAERGSDAEMQDMSLGLAGEEQVVLWQIDRALRKIDNGIPLPFGLCEHSKQPIPKTRLQLIPWTPVSIEGMNYVEENGLALEDVLIDG
jgi:RNA polymerase-binding transcription factor DksA